MEEFKGYDTITVPGFIREKHNTSWSKAEAECYRHWILENQEKRAKYLIQYLKHSEWAKEVEENENKPEIFLTIWKWYRRNYKKRERKKSSVLMEQIDMKRKGFSVDSAYADSVRYTLTEKSEAVAFDIGFYMAWEIVKHHPNIQWRMADVPKDDIEANLFQLNGFYDCEERGEGKEPFAFDVNPFGYIESLWREFFDQEAEPTDESLYQMYLDISAQAKEVSEQISDKSKSQASLTAEYIEEVKNRQDGTEEFEGYKKLSIPKFILTKDNMKWTKKETREYREWILENYEIRAEYIMQYLKNHGWEEEIRKNENRPEIFLTIWKWFRENLRVKERNKAYVLLKKISMWKDGFSVDEDAVNAVRYTLTETSEAIAIDISFCLARKVLKHHPGIQWKTAEVPKNDIEANLFQLYGFHDTENLEQEAETFIFGIDPLRWVGSLCEDIFDREEESTDESLYKMYLQMDEWTKWQKKLPYFVQY